MRFGAERAVMALVTSLFHDAGYIREIDDRQHRNGAEFTLYHVTRSARFLARFLPSIGMEAWVPISTRIVHFTGYEIKLSQIQLADGRDRKLGHLLGTADLIAQMADRCYLEKCRDRLYPEFVLGRHRGRARQRRHHAGPLQLGTGSVAPDAAIRARDARGAAGRRVRARLSVPGASVRRQESLSGGHRSQPRLFASHIARRALAAVAAQSAAVHLRGQSTRRRCAA